MLHWSVLAARHGHQHPSIVVEKLNECCDVVRVCPGDAVLPDVASSLEQIEEEQRGAIVKCKTKMLAAWLQQQDNVSRKGVPSWSVLRTALEEIGEHQLASEIST